MFDQGFDDPATGVRIGALTRDGGTYVDVVDVAIHPSYDDFDPAIFNDVAVLTLESPVLDVKPMTINRNTNVPLPDFVSPAFM